MGRIFEALAAFLEDDHWPVSVVEERKTIKTGFNGDHGEFNCFAQAREEQEQFAFYSVFPVKTNAKDFGAVAEFITRANFGMIIGNFEFDFSDGEIRYKTSVDLEGVEVQASLLRNLVYANVLTMDKYFTGLMRVMYGGITPEEAIREIEG